MPQYTAGTYSARVVSQQLAKNQRTGNYQVIIKFEPQEILNPGGEWQPIHDAEQRTMYLSVTDRSAQLTVDKLAYLGLYFDDWWQVDQDSDNCVSIIGMPITLNCRMDTYEGRVRERWDVPLGGADVVSLDRSEADILNAQFGGLRPSRGKAESAADNAPPKHTKRRGEAATASGSDDLAF